MTEPGTVVYVGGMGRSGSTLLEQALAQLPAVCGIGESVFLWERGVENDELCGCGESFSSCAFWTAVGDRAFGGWDRVDTGRIRVLRERVDDVKFVPRLLLPARWGGLSKPLREYLSYYERLYDAVREVSGCDVVVDSSKLTPLAYILSHSSRINLKLLHIVRDPRAVTYAWTKRVRRPEVTAEEAFMPTYSPLYMSLLYVGHNTLLELLRLRGVPEIRVRYEDFADAPDVEIDRVAAFAALPAGSADVVSGSPPSLRLGVVHTVAGNPSRFKQGEIVVRKDAGWRDKMPRARRRLVTAITSPSMLRLGYARSASKPEGRSERILPDVEPDQWPTVTVVLPTHNRPELMRRALHSVIGQDYPGLVETVVVFDKAEPDLSLASDEERRPVRVITNARTPGLAGARNSGIDESDAQLIAFLDDDDHWVPEKLRRQVQFLLAEPEAEFASTAMLVEYDDRSSPRLAGRDHVTHEELLRSRMAMLHSSSFLVWRQALIDGIGLVDETLPRSMAEDWDLLLRAAQRRPVVHLDEPLVRVRWGSTSYFASDWQVRNDAQLWLLEHHPQMGTDRKAAGLSYGKLAFGAAMTGHRRESFRWGMKALRADPSQPRTVLAALVAMRLMSGPWLLNQLNKHGHGV